MTYEEVLSHFQVKKYGKKERDDLQENLDICAGLADRYMYRQRIIECTLKLKNERLLRCAYAYMKKLSEGEE